ncbi:820ded6e-8ade-4189-81b8-5edc8e7cea34 [Thermothielavioides terrestris]|uniref:820ded6e-8ade-4189-81b8-5edc8e7cea34 n=1 Tax=Thermothielavioides terrestris TaxID=2587410 RepID=A0A3S4BIG2_9PEZI|nr:820ded6e-8ade-4189-81b8-5edc8e7cea34 [Thermothielavioides terrestris]
MASWTNNAYRQSALTDFLASHNISANQIRLDAEARRRAAQIDDQQGDANTHSNGQSSAASPAASPAVDASPAQTTRARRSAGTSRREEEARKKEQKAIEKIKASKKFQKRKRGLADSEDEDDLARLLMQRSAPLPGQMENCELCGTRFTVTPYTRNGPNGGLLCNPCGKELAKDDAAAKKKVKRASGGAVGNRRQVQSKILDGTYSLGAKSLMTLCIETLAKNIDLAEDLGDLPPQIIDKIARKLSKHRLLNPTTLSLFLQPTAEEVCVYDGAKLGSDDFIRIFQTVPGLKKLKIRNGIHFRDEVLDYLISRHIRLEEFYIHGANLLSESKWKKFLQHKGDSLRSLCVYWTDKHFGNEVLSLLQTTCPSLTRLKVCHNQQVTDVGVAALGNLKSLRHLSLDLRNEIHPDVYVDLLSKIGANLETLSLARVHGADNTVLDAIHRHCRSLAKLRITDSEEMTDAGFVRLFKDWANPGLVFADLQKCRQLDSAHPRENPDGIGLCSGGFRALMEHSGKTLKHLNVHGCRHIEAAAFEEVFAPGKVYDAMTKLEISFCEEVTDFVVGSIFRSCPNLRELNVFGCMKVKDVRVPRGKILVGVPNAKGMVIEGDDDGEE